MDDDEEEFEFEAGLIIHTDGEIEFIPPLEFPDDLNDPVYFLMAVYFLAKNDPDFYASVLDSVKNIKEFKKYMKVKERLH